MAPQYSTALSDGVLALSAVYVAVSLYRTSFFACIGFLMMATAASLGVLRFSRSYPSDSLINRHQYMSQLTASFGLPMIAVAYVRRWQPFLAYIILAVALGLFALQKNFSRKAMKLTGDAVAAVAMLTILVQGVAYQNIYIILGVLLFAFAVVVIKTEGYFNSIPRVDLFHYALVLANVLLKSGLLVSELPDVYYRS